MTDQQQQQPKAVLFVLPTHFASRNILFSDLPRILGEKEGVRVFFASLYREDLDQVQTFHNPRFTWLHLKRPCPGATLLRLRTLRYWCQSVFYTMVHLALGNRARHPSLVYRFNELKGFFGHQLRKRMAAGHGTLLAKMLGGAKSPFSAQRYADPKLGWPLPQSEALYHLLRSVYYWLWGNNARVETFFDLNPIAAVVINFIQTTRVYPYVNAAKRRGIPIIGMVGSWDNPTLKGPVFPGLGTYLVQSRYMAEQLAQHHDIGAGRIVVTGWPQMDIYKKVETLVSREAFRASLGLAGESKLILFGANTSRLGEHEISILRHMVGQLQAGRYGANTVLIVRPHPGDGLWRKRFAEFMGVGNVLLQEPSYTDRVHFANLIKNVDIVISSAGTISLDAVAFDTCTINIAFDGDLKLPPDQGVALFYQLEHYASIVETKGTIVVHSYAELDSSLIRFLHTPDVNSEGRQRLRRQHLEPFDGLASQRIADAIFGVISPAMR
jgi:hypothetical protein